MRSVIRRALTAFSLSGLLVSFLGQVVVRFLILALLGGVVFSFTEYVVIWLATMVLILAAALLVMIVRTPTSVLTKPHRKVLGRLLATEEEYCLLLRPFGHDGEVVLPDLPAPEAMRRPWWKRPAQGQSPIRRAIPLEQVIADAAHRARGLTTYSVVDRHTFFAPPGPRYLRASDEDWRAVVRQLIRRAHTIVLLLPPDQPSGAGFDWEVRTIAALGLQSRVVLVLPPPEREKRSTCTAAHRAVRVMAMLRHADLPAPLLDVATIEVAGRLNHSIIITKINDRGDAGACTYDVLDQGESRGSRVAVGSYLPCLVEAIAESERGLAGLSFAARYEPPGGPLAAPLPEVDVGAAAWAADATCPICGAAPSGARCAKGGVRRSRGVAVAVLLACVAGPIAVDSWTTTPIDADGAPSWWATPAPTVDACVVGTWTETAHTIVTLGGGDGLVFWAGSGRTWRLRADGTGVVDYSSGAPFTATVGGQPAQLEVTGTWRFRYSTHDASIAYLDASIEGRYTTRLGGAVRDRGPLTAMPAADRYICEGVTMRIEGDPARVRGPKGWTVYTITLTRADA